MKNFTIYPNFTDFGSVDDAVFIAIGELDQANRLWEVF